MSDLKKILESFCKIDGVKGAFLTDKDGQLREKIIEEDIELELLKSFLYDTTKTGLDIALDIQKDRLNQSYLEFEDMSLTSIILANDDILTIFSSSGVNLGRIRLEIRKNKKTIESLLD